MIYFPKFMNSHPILSSQLVYLFEIDIDMQGGVITERCYGCGRCFPVCPYDKIS
jgi:ferredoxin